MDKESETGAALKGLVTSYLRNLLDLYQTSLEFSQEEQDTEVLAEDLHGVKVLTEALAVVEKHNFRLESC